MTSSKIRKLQMSKRSSIILSICITLTGCGQGIAFAQVTGAISVPVLVQSKSGEITYSLSANDFLIKDNGIGQRVDMQEGTEGRPLSLILVIQTGHGAASQLDKIAHLGALLDSLLTNSKDQAAVITFDSRPQLFQDFAKDSDDISNSLASISAGNSGAALFDAMHMAISSLRKVPSENRKIVVLISGEHDHGSYASDNASLIRDVSASDASVYSLSFRTGKKEIAGKLRSLSPFAVSASAMQRNSSEALTQLTGGEFYRFDSEKGFEDRVLEVANHINNRYILTFHPSNPEPGFHALEVEVDYSKIAILSARTGYWLAASGATDSGESRQ
jgi:VWFA-related protein